ncbi:MAG: ThiF family adenylyltransferase, partial [Christensenellaceae bacterium]
MDDSRTVALIGEEAVSKLKNAVVAVFGVGGVGSYAAESLARSGVGTILLVDDDVVKSSNINRQLVALESTI